MHSFFIVILLLTSVIAVAFIIERGLALRWPKVIPPAIEDAVMSYDSERALPQLRQVCQQNPSTLARLLLFTSDHLDWSKTESMDLLETRARHEVAKLER